MKRTLHTEGFSRISIFLAMVFLLTLTGCKERQINPLEDERGIYSIYGALNLKDDLHYIRIKDLRVPLASDSSKIIDATVLFEDLETGTQQILQDTVVKFPGNYTHNYVLYKKLQKRQSYQVTVTRSDDVSVSSIATTPGITIHSVEPAENVDCFQPIEIDFQNVLASEQIRYQVGFRYDNQTHWLEISRICPLEQNVSENRMSIAVTPYELLGVVFPRPETNVIACSRSVPYISCNDLDSEVVRFRYLHLGPEWQNIYPIYPVDPEDVDDVNNGLGFFGAYRDGDFSFTLNTEE